MKSTIIVINYTFALLLAFFATPTKPSLMDPPPSPLTDHPNWNLINRPSCGQAPAEDSRPSPRIIGGQTARLAQFPWAVQIGITVHQGFWFTKKDYSCGGSLITPGFVLTAGHCVAYREKPGYPVLSSFHTFQVVNNVIVGLKPWMGPVEQFSKDPNCNGIEFESIDVMKVVMHPEYHVSRTFDIALLELKRRATINDCIKTVCLPGPMQMKNSYIGNTAVVAGWGGDDPSGYGLFGKVLRHVNLPIVECDTKKMLAMGRTRTICAGGVEGVDSCVGDSGSPLTIEEESRSVQIGIVSSGFGLQCATSEAGMNTDVRPFMLWILDHVLPTDDNSHLFD